MDSPRVGSTPVVTIIYRWLPAYRVPFYEALRRELAERGIRLRLVHGQPDKVLGTRRDSATLQWAEYRRNTYFYLGRAHVLVWQPAWGAALTSDLVVVEQASKLLLNYPLWLASLVGRVKMAFWGHGRNFQLHTASKCAEYVKRFMSRRVLWWFAYNDASACVLETLGFPADRITNVMNSTDAKATREMVEAIRHSPGFAGSNEAPACIYMGGLYADKQVDLAIEAVGLARESVPGLRLFVVGDGPEREALVSEFGHLEWVDLVGPRFGSDLSPYLAVSSVALLPSSVGLAAVDAFAAGLPVLTIAGDSHGPEFDYIRSGENALVLARGSDVRAFGESIVALMRDQAQLRTLSQGAASWGSYLSVESMATRFADGVERALAFRSGDSRRARRGV